MDQFIDFAREEWLLFGAFLFITFLLANNFLTSKLSGIKAIDCNEAVRLMNQEAIVVDVRLDGEFKAGHIQDAINIPLGAIESRLREIEKHKENTIIVTCQTGNRSLRGAQLLKKHGFGNVLNLSGGITAWGNANMPVIKGTKQKKKKDKAA